jgi:hypothetical protein
MSASPRWSLALALASACASPTRDDHAPEPDLPGDGTTEPTSAPHLLRPKGELVASERLGDAALSLHRDADGLGTLWLEPPGGEPQHVPCDRLVGAWGLWVDDVDGDGHSEAIVALRKAARFDPHVDNRLHVYGFEHGRCVPAWRGTRLAGRFDALATARDAPGTIVVSERLGAARRRVARYRWNGFGYAVDAVLWEGAGEPPEDLVRDLVAAPSDTNAPS